MKPQLQHHDEFKQILSNYQVNPAGIELLKNIKLVLMSSPSSAGRNTIIKKLEATGEYEFIVSHTTRPPRSNNGVMEQDGVEYWFRDEEAMLKDLKEGKFLEADVIHNQQVSGISLRELRKAAQYNKIAIDEVYYVGIDKVVQVKPDTVAIFVLPPNFEEWMRRLTSRSDMTSDEIRNRLESAEKELESTADRDYYKFVVNDRLDEAVATVRRIVEKGKYSVREHEVAKELAWRLLSKVKQQLYS